MVLLRGLGPRSRLETIQEMIERDIWASAKLLVEKYRDEAGEGAAGRTGELFRRGDLEGAAAWRRIISAIDMMQSMEPDGSVH